MKFSYNTLQSFFAEKLPTPEEVAEQVGLHMFELEGIEALENGDFLIDWDILPNRSSDCMSYMGIAGEISAICQVPMKSDFVIDTYEGDASLKTEEKLDFTLHTDKVHRATKRYAENITMAPSPTWLQEFMQSTGQKSINNVVDITNYVMWITGQPVHAFDYDKLAGNEVKNMTIRHATEGEQVLDLTGSEHTLEVSMLVVADEEKNLDIAGIKGGNNSGVDENTKRIVVSACNFDYKNIRTTSRALKLRTDASARYENEVPLCKATLAQALCAKLLEQECGATVSGTVIDVQNKTRENTQIDVRFSKINSVLGIELAQEEVVALCERLNFTVESGTIDMTVTVPLERLDLEIEEDIVEEIARLYGYYKIEAKPIAETCNIPKVHPLYTARDRAAHTLTQLGFYETMSRTLTDTGVVELTNPLTSEAGFMRLELLTDLQNKAQANFSHTETPHFFEIGKVFTGVTDGVVDEHWSFAGVLGRRKIKDKQKGELFLQTKGVLETVFEVLSVKNVQWKEGPNDETLAILEIDGNILGSVGVNFWELNFEEMVKAIDTTISYTKPSKYPKMDRDVSVFVPIETRVRDVRALIESAGAQKCTETELFDVYEDRENNRKSVGFRLVFQCYVETLSDEYTNTEMEKIYKILSSQPGFEIR